MTAQIWHAPGTIDEALDLLAEHGDEARPIAGGTALVLLMKQSLLYAEHLVSLGRIPGLDDIRVEPDGLHIGTAVRLADAERSPLVREHAPLLPAVFREVGNVRVRHSATIGGGLAHADPAQDPPPALMVLDATVRLQSARGARTLPVAELFVDYYETAIEPDELLVEVIVPPRPTSERTTYRSFRPATQDDYATVGVAAAATLDGERCSSVRVALCAAGPVPLRAIAVEEALAGNAVTSADISDAAELVREIVTPIDDFRGSAEYKREMAVVFARRALEGVLLGGGA